MLLYLFGFVSSSYHPTVLHHTLKSWTFSVAVRSPGFRRDAKKALPFLQIIWVSRCLARSGQWGICWFTLCLPPPNREITFPYTSEPSYSFSCFGWKEACNIHLTAKDALSNLCPCPQSPFKLGVYRNSQHPPSLLYVCVLWWCLIVQGHLTIYRILGIIGRDYRRDAYNLFQDKQQPAGTRMAQYRLCRVTRNLFCAIYTRIEATVWWTKGSGEEGQWYGEAVALSSLSSGHFMHGWQ